METKKSKITELNLQADMFNDMYVFTIAFENGDIGKMYKKKDKTYEQVGNEVEYTISPKSTVKMVFKGDSKFNNNTPKPSYSNSKTDTNAEIRFSVAFKGAVQLASGGAIRVNEVEEFTLKYDEFLKDKELVDLPF